MSIFENEAIVEEQIFDNLLNKASIEFSESITSLVEMFYDETLLTESEKDSVATSIKKFFTNIITAFRNFFTSIKLEVSRQIRFSSTDSSLHKMYKELKKAKEQGIQQVKVVDVWKLEPKYIEATRELSKLANKFTKMKYKRVSELNKDIEEFNTLYEKYDTELEDIAKDTIIVSVDKMLNFVEDEISNRSKILDTINDCISTMEQMNSDCATINQRYEILGPDIMPKHMSFIKKMTTSLAKFVKKWIVRIIVRVTLIIG